MRLLIPVGVGLFVLGAVSLASASSSTASEGEKVSPTIPTGPGKWVDADAPRRIRELADRIGWPGLADFLVAVAYWESRGNSQAGEDDGNKARGWFGMRPVSARLGDLGLEGDALKEESLAVALAAWYAWRLQKYAADDQLMDWLAMRRGWYLPKLVSDVNEENTASAKVHAALVEAYTKVGLDPNLMHDPSLEYQWPGVEAVIAQVRNA
jgi:hypothetical protein